MTTAEDARKLKGWFLENAGLEAQSLPMVVRTLWMMDSERWEAFQQEHTPNNLEEGVELVLSYLEATINGTAAQVAGPPAEEYLLSPSLPAEGECLLSPSPPAEGECLLSPCPPAEGECLLVLPPQPKREAQKNKEVKDWEEECRLRARHPRRCNKPSPGCLLCDQDHLFAHCPFRSYGEEPERPQPKGEEPERPTPEWEEPERPTPEWEEPERPTPEWEEPERPTPEWEEPERPTPEWEEPERPTPEWEEPERPTPEWEEPERPTPEWEEPERPTPEWEEPERPTPEWEEPERPTPEWEEPERPTPEWEEPERPTPEWEEPERPTPEWEEPERPTPEWEEPERPTPEWEEPERPTPEWEEPERPTPEWEEPERPTPEWEEPERPTPEWEEPERPTPEWEEPERPTPEWGEPERPQPKRGESVRPQPKEGGVGASIAQEGEGGACRALGPKLPAEGECLLVPPPPAEGECLLSPCAPAEDECLLSPSPPAEGECLLGPRPPAEDECLLVSLPPPALTPAREGDKPQSPARKAEPHQSPAREAEQDQSPAKGGDYTLLPPSSPGDHMLLPPPLLPPQEPEGEELQAPPPENFWGGEGQDAGVPQQPLFMLLKAARRAPAQPPQRREPAPPGAEELELPLPPVPPPQGGRWPEPQKGELPATKKGEEVWRPLSPAAVSLQEFLWPEPHKGELPAMKKGEVGGPPAPAAFSLQDGTSMLSAVPLPAGVLTAWPAMGPLKPPFPARDYTRDMAVQKVVLGMSSFAQLRQLHFEPCSAVVHVGGSLTIELSLHSHMPIPVQLEQVAASVHFSIEKNSFHKAVECLSNQRVMAGGNNGIIHIQTNPPAGRPPRVSPPSLELYEMHDKSPSDNSLNSTGVICKNVHLLLRHQESGSSIETQSGVPLEDSAQVLKTTDVLLEPGFNKIVFTAPAHEPGTYTLRQLCATVGSVQFVLPHIYPIVQYEVYSQEPQLKVEPLTDILLAGIAQKVKFTIITGHYAIKNGDVLQLSNIDAMPILYSPGSTATILSNTGEKVEESVLMIQSSEKVTSIMLPLTPAYHVIEFELEVICHILSTLSKPFDNERLTNGELHWKTKENQKPDSCQAAIAQKGPSPVRKLAANCRHRPQQPQGPEQLAETAARGSIQNRPMAVHRGGYKFHRPAQRQKPQAKPQGEHQPWGLLPQAREKYIQVCLQNMSEVSFHLLDHNLTESLKCPNIELVSMNVKTRQHVYRKQSVFCLWEIKWTKELPSSLQCRFSVNFSPAISEEESPSFKPYAYEFQLENIATLYNVKAEIYPVLGAEHCRTGSLCSLDVSITRLSDLTEADQDESVTESDGLYRTKLMYEACARQKYHTYLDEQKRLKENESKTLKRKSLVDEINEINRRKNNSLRTMHVLLRSQLMNLL
ncbi:UNVERIFIED_CONTAM: hypothetical protein FKN15_039997 [Acipenser sinensis]